MEEHCSRGLGSILLTIILTAIVVAGGMYFWQQYSPEGTQTENEVALTELDELKSEVAILKKEMDDMNTVDEIKEIISEPKEAVDESVSWKTYQNKELGFELKIPSYISVDRIMNDGVNRLTIFKSEKENFEVRIKEGKKPSFEEYYLDFPISSRLNLDGEEVLVFEAPNGYCDGPGCSDPFVVYSTGFYNFVFYGDTKLDDTEKSILSSFKFTK